MTRGFITLGDGDLPPGDYCIVSWADLCALMQNDPDLRPRSIQHWRFTVSAPKKPEPSPSDGDG